jgi:hypothetical protein
MRHSQGMASAVHRRRVFLRARFVVLFSVLSPCAWLTGCIAPLPHQPASDLVQMLGKRDAESELRSALLGSVNPMIVEVHLRGERVDYVAWDSAPFGFDPVVRSIPLAAISEIEVYPNGKTWVYVGGKLEHPFTFHSVPEARRLADVLWSFRHHVREVRSAREPIEVERVRI